MVLKIIKIREQQNSFRIENSEATDINRWPRSILSLQYFSGLGRRRAKIHRHTRETIIFLDGAVCLLVFLDIIAQGT